MGVARHQLASPHDDFDDTMGFPGEGWPLFRPDDMAIYKHATGLGVLIRRVNGNIVIVSSPSRTLSCPYSGLPSSIAAIPMHLWVNCDEGQCEACDAAIQSVTLLSTVDEDTRLDLIEEFEEATYDAGLAIVPHWQARYLVIKNFYVGWNTYGFPFLFRATSRDEQIPYCSGICLVCRETMEIDGSLWPCEFCSMVYSLRAAIAHVPSNDGERIDSLHFRTDVFNALEMAKTEDRLGAPARLRQLQVEALGGARYPWRRPHNNSTTPDLDAADFERIAAHSSRPRTQRGAELPQYSARQALARFVALSQQPTMRMATPSMPREVITPCDINFGEAHRSELIAKGVPQQTYDRILEAHMLNVYQQLDEDDRQPGLEMGYTGSINDFEIALIREIARACGKMLVMRPKFPVPGAYPDKPDVVYLTMPSLGERLTIPPLNEIGLLMDRRDYMPPPQSSSDHSSVANPQAADRPQSTVAATSAAQRNGEH